MVSGEVDSSDIGDIDFTLNEEEQACGMALICMVRACSDIVVETQADWGYSLGFSKWKGASGRFSSTPEALYDHESDAQRRQAIAEAAAKAGGSK